MTGFDGRSTDSPRGSSGNQGAGSQNGGGRKGLLLLGASLLGVGVVALYSSLARKRATPNERRIRTEQHTTINRSPDELYTFWRSLSNLPQVMSHLESVEEYSDTRSHWVAKGPAGSHVAWDAEITEDLEPQMIAWRSLEGADVKNAGSVSFTKLSYDRGTDVKVVLAYEPPAGRVGAAIAKLFGEEPEQQLRGDLRRFKQLMETGEVTTTRGQPSGRG